MREVIRALRHDIDFVALCRGFMKERTESQFKDLDAPIKVGYSVHRSLSLGVQRLKPLVRVWEVQWTNG